MNKVLLGMSGGVDSSVAAAVLLEQGYDVVGVTLKLWDREKCVDNNKMCCSINDVEDARAVAARLDIPHYVLNFKDVFKKTVVDYFVSEYLNGRTPNPCIACNRYIKFHEMLIKAQTLECDYISTGHYARIDYDEDVGRYILRKGLDHKKDQSYVLYNLTQETLGKVLLPLAGMTKDEVRKKANDIGIKVANKPDSQEICFVDKDYSEFIREYSDAIIKPGNILDTDGKIIGKHEGIINYTIGQRKGLGLYAASRTYVTKVNVIDNTVTVGKNEDLFSKTLVVRDYNLVSVDKLHTGMNVSAKIRYSAECKSAKLYLEGENKLVIEFDEPQRAITPGQSVVIYDGDIVIAGGIIE